MANDVVDMAAFAGKRAAQAFQHLNAIEDNLSDGIGASYGVLGYKGKVWSLRYHGEKYNILRPDDGTPASYIDVIILRQAHTKSKSFYAAYDANASEGARPLCASLDGVVPDSDAMQPQATACALCPHNVFKTNAQGRKEKECTDYKRLAVLLLPPITAKVLGSPLMEPVFLRVPPASLVKLGEMGIAMSKQGFHYASYITRISFDPSAAHPQMVFRALQPLTDAEGPVINPLIEDDMSKRITGEDQVNRQGPQRITQQPSNVVQLQQPAPQPQQPVQQPAPQPQQPVSTGLVTVNPTPQQPVTPPPQTQVQPTGPVDTGLTAVPLAQPSVMNAPAFQTVPPPQQQKAPITIEATAATVQTAADTGPAEESDAALDARVMNILKT